jgi:hypothetical protein
MRGAYQPPRQYARMRRPCSQVACSCAFIAASSLISTQSADNPLPANSAILQRACSPTRQRAWRPPAGASSWAAASSRRGRGSCGMRSFLTRVATQLVALTPTLPHACSWAASRASSAASRATGPATARRVRCVAGCVMLLRALSNSLADLFARWVLAPLRAGAARGVDPFHLQGAGHRGRGRGREARRAASRRRRAATAGARRAPNAHRRHLLGHGGGPRRGRRRRRRRDSGSRLQEAAEEAAKADGACFRGSVCTARAHRLRAQVEDLTGKAGLAHVYATFQDDFRKAFKGRGHEACAFVRACACCASVVAHAHASACAGGRPAAADGPVPRVAPPPLPCGGALACVA